MQRLREAVLESVIDIDRDRAIQVRRMRPKRIGVRESKQPEPYLLCGHSPGGAHQIVIIDEHAVVRLLGGHRSRRWSLLGHGVMMTWPPPRSSPMFGTVESENWDLFQPWHHGAARQSVALLRSSPACAAWHGA